ncbi:MAG: hypothetical protein IH593_08250 [Bacteroidales bacterium]|nr:hypothetical protein [Bacteroidales bacterium]
MEREEMLDEKGKKLPAKSKIKRIVSFILSCKFVLILLAIALVTVFIVLKSQMNTMEKEHLVQKNQIIYKYETKIDSLNTANIELTVKVFSWAIRSELIRQNIDAADQLMTAFVQEPNIQNVKLLNQENSMIIISTNKKEEGQEFENKELLRVDKTTLLKDLTQITVVNPIMGLNKKLGVLIVEVKAGKKFQPVTGN